MSMPGTGQRLGGEYQRPGEQASTSYGGSLSITQNPILLIGGLVVVAVAVGAAVLSLGAVPPLFVGIAYNQFSKAADLTKIYHPGRYFIGPFNNFILFPSDVQHIEFTDEWRIKSAGLRYAPLHTRTKEGLGLHLQVSLQYKLQPDKLAKLYSEFNQNYEQVFVSSVRDVLIKAASEYEAVQLWEEREDFSAKMQVMVDHELRNTYAKCWGLQLLIINLPNDFEKSIVETQVQKQLMLIREQQQLATTIRAHTSVIKAEYDRKVKVILAHGHANFTVTTKEAEAAAEQRKIDTESEAFSLVKQRLHLDATGLVKYQQYSSMSDLGEASLMFGFDEHQGMVQGPAPYR